MTIDNFDLINFTSRSQEELKSKNPYKWILHMDRGQKDEKRGLKKRPTSPSQDEHIKEVGISTIFTSSTNFN